MSTQECPQQQPLQTEKPGSTMQQQPSSPPQNNFGWKPNAPADNFSPSSSGFIDPEDLTPKNFSFNEASVRRGFLRKVYLILMGQLLFTFGIVALFLFHQPTAEFSRRNPAFTLTICILTIVVVLLMVCNDTLRRKFPLNFICLSIFTLGESILVGAIAARYESESVFLAVGITAVLCLALTIFAFQTKIDFTACGGIILAAAVCLLLFSIVAVFWRDHVVQTVYASFGALVACVFLIYDTQLMMGGNHKISISPEEYIFAALCLYLDVVRIFIYVLQLIGNRSN